MNQGSRPGPRQPRSGGGASPGSRADKPAGQGKQGQGKQGRGKQGRGKGKQGQPAKPQDRSGGAPGGKRGARRGEQDDPVAKLTGPLQKVLARLPETQRKVLELRMGLVDGHPHDLADTARTLGLSLSEARDIEKRAFEHIREAVPLQQLQRFLQP